MSKEKEIVGFDRLNRPVYPGDLVVDALGRRYEVRADGYAYDQNSPAFAALSDLNGPTLEAPLQPQRPAPSAERLALHAYDEPKLTGPAKEEKPITVVPTRRKPITGRANLSGLVRVSLISKAAGYHAGNPTQVLRGEGFEIRKNKTGQPCVLVKDRERAFDVLEAAAFEAKKDVIRAAGAAVREGVLIHPGNRPGGCLPVGGIDISCPTPEQEKEGLLKVLKDARDGKLSATVTVEAKDEIQEAFSDSATASFLAEPVSTEKTGPRLVLSDPTRVFTKFDALLILDDEDLVKALRDRGWAVTCTKSI